jgi:hypothetical protein
LDFGYKVTRIARTQWNVGLVHGHTTAQL